MEQKMLNNENNMEEIKLNVFQWKDILISIGLGFVVIIVTFIISGCWIFFLYFISQHWTLLNHIDNKLLILAIGFLPLGVALTAGINHRKKCDTLKKLKQSYKVYNKLIINNKGIIFFNDKSKLQKFIPWDEIKKIETTFCDNKISLYYDEKNNILYTSHLYLTKNLNNRKDKKEI